MLFFRFSCLILAVTVCSSASYAQVFDYLDKCWAKQVKALEGRYLSVSYEEENNRLYHSFEPWQFYTTKSSGTAIISGTYFSKVDTIVTQKGPRVTKLQWTPDALLILGPGDTTVQSVSKADHADGLLKSARLTPLPIIEYFHSHTAEIKADTSGAQAQYTLTIGKTSVTLSIHKIDHVARVISQLDHHDLYGDILSTYTYYKPTTIRSLYIPRGIKIEKVNGRIKEEVNITQRSMIDKPTPLIEKPSQFAWQSEDMEKPELKTEAFSKHIHFIDLRHTNSKVMVVEFADFLLVAEAPLTSENGELIIKEAKKIARKPIRYFTFNHHHPHYIGGVRAFIHTGAKIITIPEDTAYLNVIATGKRTLDPDELERHPKPVQTELFSDSTVITDGAYAMQIYKMGKKSEHAFDFLIYYFPEEQMLFQGELVWIDKDKPLVKAGPRQSGLYHFIKELGVPVKTIVQSWPLSEYNVKSTIAFDELERSINIQ